MGPGLVRPDHFGYKAAYTDFYSTELNVKEGEKNCGLVPSLAFKNKIQHLSPLEMDQKYLSSSIQPLQHQTGGKRPSRFKPVRFQEYRMQWGGSNLSSSLAISVSDVYVLDPECPVLAVAIENRDRTSRSSVCLPSDAELTATAESVAAAAAVTCGCRRSCLGFRHQRRSSDNPSNNKEPDEDSENYGVGEVVWTLQQSNFVHQTRCPRRSIARACQQQQQQRQQTNLQLHSGRMWQAMPLTLQKQSRLRANSAFSFVENRAPISKPPPTSPSELPSPQLPSAPLPPPPPPPPAPPHPPQQPQQPAPPSDFPALKTAAATNQLLQSPKTTSATSPTTSDEVVASGVGIAESCAESCVATVSQVLQDALLAAVRAETEPLERQLAEKDAELRRLRQELRDRDARLRRLNRLLTCRRMLMLDGVQQHLDGGDGGLTHENGTGNVTRRDRGYVSTSASTSALSSLL